MITDVIQYGLELGAIGAAAWSKMESSRAKSASESNATKTDQIQKAVQPNGDTLSQIAGQNLSLLRSMSKVLDEQTRLLRTMTNTSRYIHRRNHKILNGLYRVALGNSLILRKMGVDIPDPEPPLPDEFDRDDDPPRYRTTGPLSP